MWKQEPNVGSGWRSTSSWPGHGRPVCVGGLPQRKPFEMQSPDFSFLTMSNYMIVKHQSSWGVYGVEWGKHGGLRSGKWMELGYCMMMLFFLCCVHWWILSRWLWTRTWKATATAPSVVFEAVIRWFGTSYLCCWRYWRCSKKKCMFFDGMGWVKTYSSTQ